MAPRGFAGGQQRRKGNAAEVDDGGSKGRLADFAVDVLLYGV